jgi:hypothetical protein
MSGDIESSIRLTTFAVLARLNGETDTEIYNFFKSNLRNKCTYEQAKLAIKDACDIEKTVPARPLTTMALMKIVAKYLEDRERQKKEEERDWFVPSNGRSSSSRVTHEEPAHDETELGVLASQLAEGEFLVRTRRERLARQSERHREHSFKKGDVFVISKVVGPDDGSDDAWLCGVNVADTERKKKWIFSGDVYRIY